ncbi:MULTISPECIES: type II toxin-antitoxin system RelE/ParE family toxin [unclassified Novosphingobium]|uniref:type II toxin-antitoxin system RelE/ParE family toxin n=1 Tax=unclassified Novosphingobium TaxID=2644732 RepID=UPI0014420584|nr:toxin ParE1/3/4 [Novosphingobium sp. BK256]MBB3375849.1 toxin ParE1/3/4 [Novosphingobium sp. BK280]MBB3380262.1 toxin ParE1/3/4 [Novosphingobium sp. BK258]MBB3421957.1 toxin ParE1/3/4 [Novosphingobium sp. BK267]MBB3450613.1 toxin ParE1/3/4 [Novosphingobium sp. BK352]MBB3479123.1 toxin ParE1/3/4 [Novosphingobium sp. BK369]MBB3502437.1 toxin ParE1/3/4 [Novosphingobium sp. BK336]MBB3538222.1 toxin ParE1/3/4 [Novosphingobium sp. BK486]MBB3557618.1 toxin ParE1/3/4 [Novosphingobium sp. BK349]
MADVRLTALARQDLVRMREYGNVEFGGALADAYFMSIAGAFDLLARHPEAGPARPELGDHIRCLSHRRHRILYRFNGAQVLVVRVLHHAMDVPRALRRKSPHP